MAARPSPLAARLKGQLAKEQTAHAKTKDIANATIRVQTQRAEAADTAVEELRARLQESSKDTNALAAAKSEIELQRRREAEGQERLTNAHSEIGRLRSILDNITHGGSHVRSVLSI